MVRSQKAVPATSWETGAAKAGGQDPVSRNRDASLQVESSPSTEQQERYREAAALLRQWMQERDEFEEEIWPVLDEELRNRRLRFRVGE